MDKIRCYLILCVFLFLGEKCFSQLDQGDLEAWKKAWSEQLDSSNLSESQKKKLVREEDRNRKNRDLEWETPIEFYGKVVDEDGKAISKANVKMLVNDKSLKGATTYRAISNANGLFSLKKVSGKCMQLEVGIQNYYALHKNQTFFEFGDESDKEYYLSDFKNPVIFVMKKCGLSEPLVQSQTTEKLPIDGTAIGLDLLFEEGVIPPFSSGNSDLVASLSMLDQKKGEWALCLEVPGESGGILLSHDEFMFRAPLVGYQKKVILHREDFTEARGSTNGSVYFYLCSREGKHYLRVKMSLLMAGSLALMGSPPKKVEMGELTLNYYLNPASSTNLEYGVGNLIGLKRLPDSSCKLLYPSAEEVEAARKEYYDKDYDPLEDPMLTRYDFFP